MEKIRFGVVGLDNWYHSLPYATAIRELPDTELVAVAHVDATRLRDFAQRYDVKEYYTDYEKILERYDIDAIVLTAYTSLHAEITRIAAEQGKHILCDKPIEVSLEKTDEMIRNVKKAGVKFTMDHPFRYIPNYKKVKELLGKNAIGKPVSIDNFQRAPLPREWMDTTEPGWYVDPKKAGFGGFVDHAAHQFDSLRFLLETEGKSVLGIVDNLVHKDLKVDDYGIALVEFRNGVRAIVESTWTISPPSMYEDQLFIYGEEGDIFSCGQKLRLRGRTKDFTGEIAYTMPTGTLMGIPGIHMWAVEPFTQLLSDFVSSIKTDIEPPITIYDGRASLELGIATHKSAESGKSIELPL